MRQWVINGRRVNGLIKRTQTVSLSVTSGGTTGTATVLPSDAANTILILNGWQNQDSSGTLIPDVDVCRVTLSGSTLTVIQGGNFGNESCTAKVTIVEFWPGLLRSVQFVNWSTDPVTISAVDVNRTLLILNGWNFNNGGASITGSGGYVDLVLQAGGTQLHAAGGSFNNVGACVAEFN